MSKTRMGQAWIATLALAGAGFAQPSLNNRVLVLVNDRMPAENGTGGMGASRFVGQYYAGKRAIPTANVFHLKTAVTEDVSMEDYRAQIETPLRKLLDANGGAMRRQILYIVPVYGVPVRIGQQFAVDSVLAVMYAGHEDLKPPLRNPYNAPTGSRPPRFDAWSDQREAAGVWKMFIVARIDGPGALIAKGLVDKAITAESSLHAKSGTGYFDMQGTRSPEEWQYNIDNEIKAAAELSAARGFETFLHVQRDGLCPGTMAPGSQYYYDPAAKNVLLNALGSTASAVFSFTPQTAGAFAVRLQHDEVSDPGMVLLITLSDASETSFIRLTYPLAPFRRYEQTDEMVLEEVVGNAPTARGAVKLVSSAAAEINHFSELRLSVRGSRMAVDRDGKEILSTTAASAVPLPIGSMAVGTRCWGFRILGVRVSDASGASVLNESFTTDTTAKYGWKLTPPGGRNALWAWGWYGQAWDSYRFVTGAVGAQLTSFTATQIRAPLNADPRVAGAGNLRWGGNWVPRMLEEGVTATWGAVAEPYATLYAPGSNLLDHFWAGYNFGESFYIAENAVRWVMIAVGDPLYAPALFRKQAEPR